jgi:hypothetical protein
LVGDWASGKIYEMGKGIYDDDGNPIRRLRRTPHLANEGNWIYYRSMLIDMATGIGNIVNPGQDPQVMIRWSNNWGRTWGNTHYVSAGRMGEYNTRVHLHQMGRARGRTFEIVVSDLVPWDIVEGYIDIDGGKID